MQGSVGCEILVAGVPSTPPYQTSLEGALVFASSYHFVVSSHDHLSRGRCHPFVSSSSSNVPFRSNKPSLGWYIRGQRRPLPSTLSSQSNRGLPCIPLQVKPNKMCAGTYQGIVLLAGPLTHSLSVLRVGKMGGGEAREKKERIDLFGRS